MDLWVPLALFGVLMGALMVALTRYQASRYQIYLSRHNETAQQMLAEQQRTQQAVNRQTAALERIAIALEHRQP